MTNHVRVVPARMSRRDLRGFSPDRLVELRTAAQWTRGDLARTAGVSVAAVQSWETGRSKPSVENLSKVAAALNAPIDQIVVIDPSERFLGDLRVLAGMTQPRLAAKIGMSTALLSSVELGEAKLTHDVAQRIATALDVSIATVVEAYERARTRPTPPLS